MAVALAFLCAVVYGVADYSGGRAARSTTSLIVSLTGQVAGGVMALIVVLSIGTPLPPGRDAVLGAIAGLAGAAALASFYRALSSGAMTVVAPITAITSAVLPVAFGLVDGERPQDLAYIGMAVAVAAVALVSGVVGSRGTSPAGSTIVLAFVAGVGFALIFIALGETSRASGVWSLVAARAVSITILATIAMTTRSARDNRRQRGAWRLAVMAGILDMSANLLYLVAVRRGLLSVVVVVVALYPVSTVCLAFGLDKERVTRSQAAGMGLAVTALVLVSLS